MKFEQSSVLKDIYGVIKMCDVTERDDMGSCSTGWK